MHRYTVSTFLMTRVILFCSACRMSATRFVRSLRRSCTWLLSNCCFPWSTWLSSPCVPRTRWRSAVPMPDSASSKTSPSAESTSSRTHLLRVSIQPMDALMLKPHYYRTIVVILQNIHLWCLKAHESLFRSKHSTKFLTKFSENLQKKCLFPPLILLKY